MTSPVRIMHLEDNRGDLLLVHSVFEAEGFDCEFVHVDSQESFLAALENSAFDLILSDYALPSFDGIRALAIVRERNPTVPFIFVSGTMGEELAIETLKAGATDYVLKERLSRLVPSVRRALAESHERKERWRAQQTLLESEERYRSLVTALEEGILLQDGDGVIRACNPAAARMLGHTVDQIVGVSSKDPRWRVVREDGSPLTPENYPGRQTMRTGEPIANRVIGVLKPSGEQVWLSVNSRPLLRGGESKPYAVVSSLTDITKRRIAEERLRESQKFLRQVIDADPNMIFVKDWDGRFTLANKAVAEMYGTSPEMLVGKTDADFNPNQEEVESFLRDDREVMKSRERKLIPEERVSNPETKETRWFQTVKVPLLHGDTSHAVLGVATDITERVQLEEQLRQSQKIEAIGRLAGGVAHDFNNLLTTILGYSDLVLQALEPDHAVREDLEEIKRAGERAAGLTRQLLAFSRKQILTPVVLDVNAVVVNLKKMLGRLIGEDVELTTLLDPALGAVKADAGQLEQIVMNLAVNARDAMPEGGHITIETKNVELDDLYAREHTYTTRGPYVLLAIGDTGMGMDPETQSHIFEPFFTTKGPGKGTGLGLSTVYGIVKQSGGSIEVYSEPGKGTVFRIYLPRVDQPVPKPIPPPVAASAKGSETILLVEDEDGLRALARRVLEASGYTVLAARDAENAAEIAGAHADRIELLLTDTVMPGASGPDLARRLAPLRPDMKVLFVSGYTDDAVVRARLLDPSAAFLQKPFSPDALARKVREVLSGGQN